MQQSPFQLIHVVGSDTTGLQADALQAIRDVEEFGVQRVILIGASASRAVRSMCDAQVRAPKSVPWCARRTLRDFLSPKKPALLHVWSLQALGWLAAGVQSLARHAPELIPPIVLELEPSGDLERHVDSFRLLNVFADLRIICEDETFSQRLRHLDVSPDRCLSIPTGVEHERLGTDDRAALRDRLGLKPEQLGILPLPPIARASGAFTAAWGAMLLEHARPGIRLILPERGPETTRIVNLVEACRMSHMLVPEAFDLSWPMPLKVADLAVFLPTRTAATAGVHWAMAAACPLIVSEVPVLRRLLDPEQTAWFVPPDNPKEACRALLTVLEDPEQSRRRAEAARAQANAAFGRRRMLEQYGRFYASLLGERRLRLLGRVALVP